MGDNPDRLYCLDGVAHIAGVINEEAHRCITSMRRQQGMRLDEKIVPYLQMAGLYHLARLNEIWFRLDEPLASAFVERWRPETHDVAYQLGLSIDGHYVSGCLTEFERYIEDGHLAWVWFEELLGVLPHANCIDKFTVRCSWMHNTFRELPDGANDATVRRYV
ncbi:protein MAIN-LIKE 2-like [Arachis ipaensis]|uniref:protein MAIN-LIKE 2-like n=1 Tax=Arachis ipaensis TaxID=130454 RepID=UPI0007AFB620|nr:protein MAIN-LIKE 2-like [Arachis ipaensis]XP_025657892.1 protein MAIN-LIKE 2-like [Arachis hypogaea]